MQFLVLGKRILVCSSSNAAVDNLAIRFLDMCDEVNFPWSDYNPIRIGSMISVNKDLSNLKINNLEIEERKQIERKIYQLNLDINSLPENSIHYEEKIKLLEELQDELTSIVNKIIQKSQLTFGTLSSNLKEEALNGLKWDVLIIDEASQSKITECLIPLKLCNRVILAGDHQQLPPVFKSFQGFTKKLTMDFYKSFFEMIYLKQNHKLSIPLKVQYRMNQWIMDYSSNKFYNNSLIAHKSVKYQLLINDYRQLYEDCIGFFSTPLYYLDTYQMKDYYEEQNQDTSSFYNWGEVQYIIYLLDVYFRNNVLPENIGIITGYRDQVNLIFSLLVQSYGYKNAKRFEINTVDSFQGREKDIIILSLVRSHEVGFFRDPKRINVALTRAKKQLVIIGNLTMFSKKNPKVYKSLHNHLINQATCLLV